MNFFKLSLRNVKQNFRSYITYFICTVFSVMVFYIFYAICFNKQFAMLQMESMKLSAAFKTSSVVIAIFSAIFIWYSNSFFIKRRKKEIGTYSLLGMGKRQIARMLFFESISMGAVALACGIFLGTLFSKLFAMILMSLMKDTAKVTFFIETKAALVTIGAFSLIFIINSIHSYSLIYRFRLIDLFNAQKQGEKAPKVSAVFSLLSVALIGTGYIMAVTLQKLSINRLLLILGVTVIGTYILFNNLIIYLVKLVRKNRNYYFSGVNMIGISNILYRIKGNSRTLATIAVLSAVTITAVGTTYTLYSTITDTTLSSYPYSAEHVLTGKDTDSKITEIINKHTETGILSVDKIEFINTKLSIPGYAETNSSSFDGYILPESKYNEIVKHNKKGRNITLGDDNKCLFVDGRYNPKGIDECIGKSVTAKTADASQSFLIQEVSSSRIVSLEISKGTLVVKDDIYNKLIAGGNITTQKVDGYMFKKPLEAKALIKELTDSNLYSNLVSIYYDAYVLSFRSFGVLIYIGAFLGILFFLATGSIIYFKQLMEAYDDRDKYTMLKKIGASRKEIKKSISKQLLVVFGLPLVVGISHSSFALVILRKMMPISILKPCLAVMGVYMIFYIIYYFATVNSFVRTIDTAV